LNDASCPSQVVLSSNVSYPAPFQVGYACYDVLNFSSLSNTLVSEWSLSPAVLWLFEWS